MVSNIPLSLLQKEGFLPSAMATMVVWDYRAQLTKRNLKKWTSSLSIGKKLSKSRLIFLLIVTFCLYRIGYVACGLSHTVCVSKDGASVWSFGDGDYGKLGHGDTTSREGPTRIVVLSEKIVTKVGRDTC